VAEMLIMTPGSISGVKPLSPARFITLARNHCGSLYKIRKIDASHCARSMCSL
jgi:hypothetical protein